MVEARGTAGHQSRGNHVHVARDLSPMGIFAPLHGGESQTLGRSGERHATAPRHGFATRNDHDRPVLPQVLDVALVRGDHQEPRVDHPNQRATAALMSLTQQLLPSARPALRVPPVRKFVISVDELVREALFGSPVSA
jgi:hypothetical protein